MRNHKSSVSLIFHHVYRGLLFFCLLLYGVVLHANVSGSNSISISNYSTKEGLLSNEVNCIIEDDLGMMWFGTTSGISSFDGIDFKEYHWGLDGKPLFLSTNIKLLAKRNDGDFVVVGDKGIDIFNPKTFSSEHIEKSPVPFYNIKSLLVTKNGDILLGTTAGLYKFDLKEKSFDLLFKGYVKSIFEDTRGYIWIGTWGKGFYCLNLQNKTVQSFDWIAGREGMRVTGFAEDPKHRIWVSTWGDSFFVRLDKPFDVKSRLYKRYNVENRRGALSDPVMYGIEYDASDNCLWFATGNGFYKMNDLENPLSFQMFDPEQIKGSEIHSIFLDSRGNKWISVFGNGVCKVSEEVHSFRNYSFDSVLLGSNIITSIYPVSDSRVLLGCRLGVAHVWNPANNTVSRYSDLEYLNGISEKCNAFVSIKEDKTRKRLWIGTRYDGVYLISAGRTIRMMDKYPRCRFVEDMAVLPDGNAVVLFDDGLYKVSVDKKLQYKMEAFDFDDKDSLKVRNITCVLYSQNKLWLGTDGYGIIGVDDKGHSDVYGFEEADAKSLNVLCLYEDSRKRIWTGTNGGVFMLNKNGRVFEHNKALQSVSGNIVYSIVETRDDRMWMATGKGIVCMDMASDGNVKLYTASDGVGNTQFIPGAVAVIADSVVAFGGYNGIDCFTNPQEDVVGKSSKTAIVNISIKNVPLIELMQESDVEAVCLPPYLHELELEHDQNNIMFEYSNLSFAGTASVRYAYMMEGIDKEWIYADERRVSYNNLTPGTYVFKVKSCDDNGIWSEPAEVRMTIKSPMWLTWWAFVVYVILFVALTYVAYRIVKKHIKLQNELKIEQIERQKSEELNGEKLKFFTNISHELFTPLSVIQCSIDNLRQQNSSDGEILSIMHINLLRLQRLLRQIMEFRKAESGNLKLKVSRADIVSFVSKLCRENFLPMLQSKHISLNFSAEKDTIYAYFDLDKMDKILYNLLSNAVKYNYRDGVVMVSVSECSFEDGMHVIVKVENTGDGIPASRLPMLFKRFYEGDYRKFKTTGTGIGLSLTKDLVELHHGHIDVKSTEGETTVFTIDIPAYAEAYSGDQFDEVKEEADLALPVSAENEERLRLLLVEDDSELQLVMSKVLSHYYDVSTASDGKEAMEVMRGDNAVDILVTDYVMPEMNGIELCKAVRQDKDLCHIPIVMLTGRTQVEYQLEGYNAGVDVYVSKPIEMAVLLAQLRTLVDNRKKIVERFKQNDSLDMRNLNLSDPDKDLLDKIVKIVEEHIEDTGFSYEQLCDIMGSSTSTLYRKLKSLTGMSGNELIRNIRIKKACMLLAGSNMSVADVAYAVGFTDPKYFGLVFRKEMGMSPSKYREDNQKN